MSNGYSTHSVSFALIFLWKRNPYSSFLELNSDPEVATIMENLYGDINDVDPWVGMLSEEHMSNALFGETIMKIMEVQFGGLRDGDRFYFENDPALSAEEILEIKNTNIQGVTH